MVVLWQLRSLHSSYGMYMAVTGCTWQTLCRPRNCHKRPPTPFCESFLLSLHGSYITALREGVTAALVREHGDTISDYKFNIMITLQKPIITTVKKHNNCLKIYLKYNLSSLINQK